MKLTDHRKDFNQRWNIPSTSSYEESFTQFRQRIINIFNSMKKRYYNRGIDDIVTNEDTFYFCQYYSIPEKQSVTIINRLHEETNEKAFYRLIEIITLLNVKEDWRFVEMKQYLIEKIKEAIKMSKVNVTIGKIENGIKLYPKGEETLDEELVNEPLSFLNKESNKHFQKSLELYESKKFRESGENLYRSLEEFLRYILGNKKRI